MRSPRSGQARIAATRGANDIRMKTPAVLPDLKDHRQRQQMRSGAVSSPWGLVRRRLRRELREGETERALRGITGGCATNANDAEAGQEAGQHHHGAAGQVG
jgi:hypothetical protein